MMSDPSKSQKLPAMGVTEKIAWAYAMASPPRYARCVARGDPHNRNARASNFEPIGLHNMEETGKDQRKERSMTIPNYINRRRGNRAHHSLTSRMSH